VFQKACVEWVGTTAADEGARTRATELRHLLATRLDGACADGGNAATEAVENVNRQLRTRFGWISPRSWARAAYLGEGFNLRS